MSRPMQPAHRKLGPRLKRGECDNRQFRELRVSGGSRHLARNMWRIRTLG